MVILESVDLRMCLRHASFPEPAAEESHGLTLHPAFLAQGDSLEASWRFSDPESGVHETMWAVGTVRGGQQLQVFTSVGRATHGTNRNLEIRHGMKLFVTVVGMNGAGLATKLQPAPLVVDFTPPEMGNVIVASEISKLDAGYRFLSGNVIRTSWRGTDDKESGIDYCEWGIGLQLQFSKYLTFIAVPDFVIS